MNASPAGARRATVELTAADTAWSAAQRQARSAAAQARAARFDRNEPVARLLAEHSAQADQLVRAAWQHALPGDATAALALFAVGGFGRGGLYPHSDIDLLVLAETAPEADIERALARFVALLWDIGLPLAQALRTPQQCRDVAAADITVMTALLDARLLSGDAEASQRLHAAIAPTAIWPPREYFLAKRDEWRRRHARFGHTADNLEPNLKEGPGGLRDLQTLGWMAKRVFGVDGLHALLPLGRLGSEELAALERVHQTLMRLRFGLHLVAGKAEERLRFDHQKALAARLGFHDAPGRLAVEAMMQDFYRGAALVQRIGERLLQRFEEAIEGEAVPEPLDARFEVRRNYLAARDPAWPNHDPASIFALFARWAAHPALAGLHSQTARALAESLSLMPSFEQAPASLHAAFLALLRGPQPVTTLERMARLGVLGRFLPAFAMVSGRMQFDLFHVFTVDQHTLAVLRNMDGFTDAGTPDSRFGIAREVWPRLPKPELLLLAGLFHDIAKGRGGHHSELGAVDAEVFCRSLGLPAADTALVSWLVLHHLDMSTTAQKQDIADPDVVHRFAGVVADRERLDYLYLLTCADIAGTSPALWNDWKDRLLAELYSATRLALRRGLEHPVAASSRIGDHRVATAALLVAEGVAADDIADALARMPDAAFLRQRPERTAWQARALLDPGAADTTRVRVRRPGSGEALEIFVSTPDRDGLFAALVAALDRLGLAIQNARVLDAPGQMAFDTFDVLPLPGNETDPLPLEDRLADMLAGPLAALRPVRRATPVKLRHFRIATRIGFDAGASGRTVLSLVCTDRPGLLADVTDVLRKQRLRVHDARIATFGERAEDVFQITDADNRPLDADACQALAAALHTRLDG